MIDNFCNGTCDARKPGGGFEPAELPEGRTEPCDPFAG